MKHTTRTLVMTLVSFLILSTAWVGADDWPQWRGPNADNKVTGFAQPKTWPTARIIAAGPCIVAAGSLAASDLASGKSKWPSAGVKAGYGSPVFMTVEGVKQVVIPASGQLAGVNYADGNVLWKVSIGGAYQ